MIRAIHDFPAINSSLEWIFNPNIVEKDYRVSRIGAISVLGSPQERWTFFPEMRFNPSLFDGKRSVGNPALAFIEECFSG
jgi:hypothetical protein